MSDMIKAGDRVEITFVPEDGRKEFCKGVVLNMPRGEGDLLQIKDNAGKVFAFNPYFREFDCMVKLEK